MTTHGGDRCPAGLDELVERLADVGAAGVVERACAEAEEEAVAILRERLVAALVRQASALHPGAAGVDLGADGRDPPGDTPDRAAGRARHQASVAAVGRDEARRGVYLYGVTCPSNERAAGQSGVGGSPTYGIAAGDVVAVASDVSAPPLSWGVGPDGRTDLDLIAPHARTHESVLERVLEGGPVVPARFGTMYPSAEAIHSALAAGGDALGAAVERLRGRAEWGLTVRWHPARAEAVADTEDRFDPREAAGAGYLSRRSRHRQLRTEHEGRRHEVASGVHAAAAAMSFEATHRPVRPGEHPEGGGEELLRGTYLVADSARAAFEAAIVDALEAWTDFGLEGELTGPWPPYSFATVDLPLEASR